MRSRDTHPEAEEVLVRGYAEMPAHEKLERVVELNRAVEEMAAARIRTQYGSQITERELSLRLAALTLGDRVMLEVFGWDTKARGL